MKILLATGNPHKFAEITAILPRQTKTGEKLVYVSLKDFPNFKISPEDGHTLEENARIKALPAAKQTGLLTISDDTGLEVDALNGRPGVHTARYAGDQADADDNNRKLLAELGELELNKRSARFRTVACLAMPDEKTLFFEGVLEGYIGFGYRGENGFGYDPIFVLPGTQKTLAELSPTKKNMISHRAQAFEKVAKYLKIIS